VPFLYPKRLNVLAAFEKVLVNEPSAYAIFVYANSYSA